MALNKALADESVSVIGQLMRGEDVNEAKNKYDAAWLVSFMERMHARMLATSKAKNADYTGASAGDPFANFRNVECFGIQVEVGFITRMTDKLARIASYVKKGQLQVKDESVTDTLVDLANYCLLFAAYLESKK